MGDTKRQHYVPRSYLKRFSFDAKRLHTCLLNRKGNIQEIKDISISAVCEKRNYYTIMQPNKSGMAPLDLEKKFFQDYAEPKSKRIIDFFDSIAKDILQHNFKSESISITDEQKLALIQAVFIQYCRSPRSKNFFLNANEGFKLVHNEIFGLQDNTFIGMDVTYNHAIKTYCNPVLFCYFANKLSNYSMLLRISNTGNFSTSDNPVVIHKLGSKGKDVLNVNLLRDDFSIFYPLTPYLMLEFYNPIAFPQAKKMNNTISIVDTKYQYQLNKYQYVNAERHIFSFKNDFLFL